VTGGIALVAGATGLVAQAVLRQLDPGAWQDVRALTRRPFEATPPVRPIVVDYEQPNLQLPLFGVTHLFSCLGTTMKQAGSREAFRRVDHDIPLMIARAAREAGVPHCLLVSSVGAAATSRTFYLRVKADLEQAVIALGFRSVTIVRPSFLEGDRQEKRLGEILAVPFMKLAPERFKSVHVDQVARAMLDAARAARPGVEFIENPALRRF
jgi:uncharacterized protein YbjT (DUF2867 family)